MNGSILISYDLILYQNYHILPPNNIIIKNETTIFYINPPVRYEIFIDAFIKSNYNLRY